MVLQLDQRLWLRPVLEAIGTKVAADGAANKDAVRCGITKKNSDINNKNGFIYGIMMNYVYMYLYVFICIYMYLYVFICIYMYLYVFICIYMYLYVFICIYMYLYVFICIYMYLYVFMA